MESVANGVATIESETTGALVILQSLICVLREKNVLTRADIDELCERVTKRATHAERDPLPCCREATRVAAAEMTRISDFTSRRYGGKLRPIR